MSRYSMYHIASTVGECVHLHAGSVADGQDANAERVADFLLRLRPRTSSLAGLKHNLYNPNPDGDSRAQVDPLSSDNGIPDLVDLDASAPTARTSLGLDTSPNFQAASAFP